MNGNVEDEGGRPPIMVHLACNHGTGDFRMADIPHLSPGRYRVRAVGTGRYPAWSAWRSDPPGRKPWTTRFHIVTCGQEEPRRPQPYDDAQYDTPEEALARAGTHIIEVKNEQILIFCILDAAQDNRGGLTLEIVRLA